MTQIIEKLTLLCFNFVMKIMQISTTLSGGAGIAARRLNSALVEIGIDSNIVGISNKNISTYGHESILQRNGFQRSKSKINTVLQARFLQKGHEPMTTISVESLVRKHEMFEQADIIHIHATYNLINEKGFREILNSEKKIFITMHDCRLFTGGCHYPLECKLFEASCNRCPKAKVPFQRLVEKAFRERSMTFSQIQNINLISPSIWLAEEAKKSKVLNNRRVEVIRNPIPNIFLIANRALNRKKFGFNSNHVVVAFVAGDLENPNKGLDTLVKALKIMLISEKHFKLLLVGKNLKKSQVVGLDYVAYETSSDSDLADLLSAADVLVVPSVIDNSPNVIGEAIMCGLSVIGARTGGITEVMNEMDFPTFEVNDVPGLAIELENFRVEYDRESIKNKAISRVGNKIVASQMVKLYGFNS